MSIPEPVWLTITDVVAIQEKLLHEHGGLSGIRDLGLLESALARPRHQYAYGERDSFVLATAYAAGITRNHPFLDGNKRAAFMSAFVFLGINGQDLIVDETEVVHMVLGLTEKNTTEAEFAAWLKKNCVAVASAKATRKPRIPKKKR